MSPQAGERGAERLGGAMRRAPRATRFFASSPFLLGPSSILIFFVFSLQVWSILGQLLRLSVVSCRTPASIKFKSFLASTASTLQCCLGL